MHVNLGQLPPVVSVGLVVFLIADSLVQSHQPWIAALVVMVFCIVQAKNKDNVPTVTNSKKKNKRK